jgi:signal transduction histidine kinase/CheY-like chemotaxis protein/HPt (histidine-containing phosphotransfer) domain-containing protein
MPASPDRLAQDLQRTLQDLQKEKVRTQQLLRELDRQNAELDSLRSSVHRESNTRLLAEEALDETRDRLQLAVDAAGLALWDWQLPSPEVFLTARWGEMLGDVAMDGYWKSADLLQRIHPNDRVRLQNMVEGLLSGRHAKAAGQYRIRSATGWVWMESHGMVAERDGRGQPLRLMGTHADIGERKRVEADIERARELAEQASQAKSEFLANISHEVRTPLNALMGLTRLLMDSRLDPEQKSWLDLMDSSAHALLSLLNDVLDLSRIEAGKMQLEHERFHLHNALTEVSSVYSEQARSKSITWALTLAPDLPVYLEGDAGRLRQVLGNLLSNALKFTPRGGRIDMAVLRAAPAADGAQCWQIRVKDSGVGISSKQQATLFDAFTQADASTARRYGGSGLGLAICARLVQLMGGNIAVNSALAQGSCFTVSLPLNEAPMALPKSAPQELGELAAAGERFAGLCVLVAEDHPVNELLMNQLLKRLGCTVRNARDGEQAVAQWAQGGVDLVLMDVQMPGTNGLQASQRIRELESQRGLARTPIVAVTANAMVGDRATCLAAGMDGYTPKPVSPQALMAAMDTALQGHRDTPEPPATDRHEHAPTAPRSPAAANALDIEKLRRRLDGDEATLRQLALAMQADLRERLLALKKALAERNAESAVVHAHGLKGSLGSMTAERGARLAKGLELAALARDWTLFGRVLPLLVNEASAIEASLAAVLSAAIPPAG